MDISCQFATSLRSAEHIAAAEAVGYQRAWLFDTPAQSPDVWAMLALAAQQTRRIGLGPGVLVPTLRHPMVNASGAAMLSALAFWTATRMSAIPSWPIAMVGWIVGFFLLPGAVRVLVAIADQMFG